MIPPLCVTIHIPFKGQGKEGICNPIPRIASLGMERGYVSTKQVATIIRGFWGVPWSTCRLPAASKLWKLLLQLNGKWLLLLLIFGSPSCAATAFLCSWLLSCHTGWKFTESVLLLIVISLHFCFTFCDLSISHFNLKESKLSTHTHTIFYPLSYGKKKM